MEEDMESGKTKMVSLPVQIPSVVNHLKTPEIHLQRQTDDCERKELTDSDELMLLYESYSTDINSNTPVREFKTSQLRLFSTGSPGLALTSGLSPGPPNSKSESLEVRRTNFFSLNNAFDSLVVNPFRNFHENLRQKLLVLKKIKDNQETRVKTENLKINTDFSDFHKINSFPNDIDFEISEVFNADSEFDTDEYIEGTRKRRSTCCTPETGSIKIPKTPWHSPARDVDDIFNPIKVLNYGCDDLILNFPGISKSFPLSPGNRTKLSSCTESKETHLCRVFAPSWLQWQPQMNAFICDYNETSTKGYYIDLQLPELNLNNECYIVKEEDYHNPGMDDKITLNIPHGMKWVKMSSGSGFLVTTIHLDNLGARRCLPSTWRTYTHSIILSRNKPHKDMLALPASH